MIIYVDIDNTICVTEGSDYLNSKPIQENIDNINDLFYNSNTIIYWTARGSHSKKDQSDLTKKQLKEWGCLFYEIICNEKPNYDILICDKTKRIDEI